MDKLSIVLAILLMIPLIVLFPLVLIWALNTLFALSISYTFTTWLAALVLLITLNGSRVRQVTQSSQKSS